MGNLSGFRSPQFSEDGARPPWWLQQEGYEAETIVQGLNQEQSPPQLCVEECCNCEKHICSVSTDKFLGEDGRYNNWHLYLSADDSSLFTVTPCNDNVPFHLQLSLDCDHEGIKSPPFDTFQAERNELYCIQPEILGEPEVKVKELNADQNIDAINCSLVLECRKTDKDKILEELERKPSLSDVEQMHEAIETDQLIKVNNVMNCSLDPECDTTPKGKCLKGLEEDVRLLEIEQTDEAVELSISASEALVIHEVLRTLSLKLPVAAVLETALQVKQARLEAWKESRETCYNWLSEETSETGFQSESEDIDMEDAHHDVDTFTSQHDHLLGDKLSVSQVKDTFDSGNCGDQRKSEQVEFQLPDTNLCPHSDDYLLHGLEDVPEDDLQFKLNKTGDYISEEDFSLQPTCESPPEMPCEVDGQHYGVSGRVPNRFQSRWFGGWSGNDTCISIPLRPNHIQTKTHFIGETSYFSESANTVPDENSFVGPKDDKAANLASQSTIPSEGIDMNYRNNQVVQVLLSQDVCRYPSPSPLYPHCSFVPCTISSQNVPCHSALRGEQDNKEKFIIHSNECIENLHSNSNMENKVFQEQVSISEASCDRQEHYVHKKKIEGSQTISAIAPNLELLKLQLIHENQDIVSLGTRKRVGFAEKEAKISHKEKRKKQQIMSNTCNTIRASKCLRLSSSHFESRAQNRKGDLSNCQSKFVKKSLFQSMKFLLTGFSKKNLNRIEGLIRTFGGTVLSDIPSENQRKRSSRHRYQTLPVVLCPKKLQTMKFLYGCAVGSLMVKAKWLIDSIAANSLLPPEQYMVLQKSVGGPSQTEIPLKGSRNSIFDGVGIMLHGAKRICSRMARIIEHGGGRVFKTLQKLVLSLDAAKVTVGFVVIEAGSWASRHLKQCALDKKIPIMSVQWIVNSLHAQKLLPFIDKKDTFSPPLIKLPDACDSVGCSQEI